jgi:hypothetical protein
MCSNSLTGRCRPQFHPSFQKSFNKKNGRLSPPVSISSDGRLVFLFFRVCFRRLVGSWCFFGSSLGSRSFFSSSLCSRSFFSSSLGSRSFFSSSLAAGASSAAASQPELLQQQPLQPELLQQQPLQPELLQQQPRQLEKLQELLSLHLHGASDVSASSSLCAIDIIEIHKFDQTHFCVVTESVSRANDSRVSTIPSSDLRAYFTEQFGNGILVPQNAEGHTTAVRRIVL